MRHTGSVAARLLALERQIDVRMLSDRQLARIVGEGFEEYIASLPDDQLLAMAQGDAATVRAGVEAFDVWCALHRGNRG